MRKFIQPLIIFLGLLTFAILVIIIIRFSGQEPSVVSTNTVIECQFDNDCTAGGCSGEICHSINEEPVFSTCIWKDEYTCYAFTNCSCVEGKCQWENNAAFQACLKDPTDY